MVTIPNPYIIEAATKATPIMYTIANAIPISLTRMPWLSLQYHYYI
jgi:hypothetical protein